MGFNSGFKGLIDFRKWETKHVKGTLCSHYVLIMFSLCVHCRNQAARKNKG